MKGTFENYYPFMWARVIFFKSTLLQWIEIISEVKDLNPLCLLKNARKKICPIPVHKVTLPPSPQSLDSLDSKRSTKKPKSVLHLIMKKYPIKKKRM